MALRLKELYWTVTRHVGLEHLHSRDPGQIILSCLGYIFWPVLKPLTAFLSWGGLRIINAHRLQIERIGHFAIDIDTYLKKNLLENRRVTTILVCPSEWKPNRALLEQWSKHLVVVRNRFLLLLLRPLMSFPEIATPLKHLGMVGWQAWDHRLPFSARLGASPTFSVQAEWAGRDPLLRLSEIEITRGQAELRKLGVPDNAWFVCVHCREGGYSPSDEHTHSIRNANITDYFEAMDAIVARGGWCIRVGDKSMQPIQPRPGVVDYVHTESKSDWMDVFLCATCRFVLGTSSGLFCLAGIFGKPSALANMTPFYAAYSPFPHDLSIIKQMKDASGRVMNWPEVFGGDVSHFRLTEEFQCIGVTQVDNTPNEIAEMAIEMLDRIDGAFIPLEPDVEDQRRFRAMVRPTHYCFGAASHIGRDFLRHHRDLLYAKAADESLGTQNVQGASASGV